MNISLLIYLIGIADSFAFISIVFLIIFIGCLLIMTLAIIEGNVDEDDKILIKLKKIAKFSFVVFSLTFLIPDSKTLAAMYLAPKIIESKTLNDLSGKGLEVLNLKFDEWIKDLKEDKKD